MLTIKEVQGIELEIMQCLHIYCQEHQLKYCMAYGTLLGAVRHEGFIPWDNDMDIWMPRPDFEKLLKMVQNDPLAPHLECVHYTTDSQYHYQVIRVCDMRTTVCPPYIREQPEKMGVWVDIFPVDGVWEKPWQHPIQQMLLWFYKKLQLADIYALADGKGLKKKIKRFVHVIFPGENNIHEYKIDCYAAKCRYEEHVFCSDTVERNKRPICLPRENFDSPVEMKFEKYKFWAPKNWKEYLEAAYGDYMQLPPESRRQTHEINAEWRKG